jgi:hypothetical protein
MSDQTIDNFNSRLSIEEATILDSLDTPARIQAFLDGTRYPSESFNRNPLRVLREKNAHCLDGAIFAAALLRRNGEPPLIVDLLPTPGADDDHVLTIFKRHDRFGALAKSNFTGLRMREPVYRSIRELVMSYFEDFFNVDGVKTLRAYTRWIDLRVYDHFDWMWSDTGVDFIEQRLYSLKRLPLIDQRAASFLAPVDKISYQAGMMVANPEGLYQPKRDHPA